MKTVQRVSLSSCVKVEGCLYSLTTKRTPKSMRTYRGTRLRIGIGDMMKSQVGVKVERYKLYEKWLSPLGGVGHVERATACQYRSGFKPFKNVVSTRSVVGRYSWIFHLYPCYFTTPTLSSSLCEKDDATI